MENFFPFLNSVETFLTDVNSIRSSELSLKQFEALLDEELREGKHMADTDTKNSSKRIKTTNWKTITLPTLKTSIKCALGLSLILVLAAAYNPYMVGDVLINFDEDLALIVDGYSKSISRITEKYVPLILRYISTSLGFEKIITISDFEHYSCLVKNPLYKYFESLKNCTPCKAVDGFVYDKMVDHTLTQPSVLTSDEINFNIARLQQILNRSEVLVNNHTVSLRGNVDYVNKIEDLKENSILERLEMDKNAHIFITCLSYISSHVFRREFPRIPETVEVSGRYKNVLYIDGKTSSIYDLEISNSDQVAMYIQSVGSRRLIFEGRDNCKFECKTFSRVMKPGDVVIYDAFEWDVRSEGRNEKSIAYMDYFTRQE